MSSLSLTAAFARYGTKLANPQWAVSAINANGELVGEDDDSAGGSNANLIFVAPEDATYTIIANTFSADEFGEVAAALATTRVTAIEINLSCPNLEGGGMFALDAAAAARVVTTVRKATELPLGAKLSPNSEDIVAIAAAVAEAGADWVVLGNTVWGAGFDVETRRPLLSGVVGGYSGRPIKPIALRCVWEVSRSMPDLPILGTGGVASGEDVVEFLLAGASAVGGVRILPRG